MAFPAMSRRLFGGLCDCFGPEAPSAGPHLPRRRLAAMAAAAATTALAAPAIAQPATTSRTRLVTLGIAAGRSAWRGSKVGACSSAVVVGRDVYVIDFGKGWVDHFFEAGLGAPGKSGSSGGFESLRAGFLTHLHADHVADLPELILYGATDGMARRTTPMPIIGPGPGLLPNRTRFAATQPLSPDSPTPGTVQMIERLYEAFAADLNDNMFDSGMPDPHGYLIGRDIALPPGITLAVDVPPPAMKPFEVYRDENVTVSAILVDHGAMKPSFGYRFDTADGSIAFSGDTTANPNVIELARGADILVHEALDRRWANSLFPPTMTEAQKAKLNHLTGAHTAVQDIGPIAQAAGVKLLVLSHLAPFDLPEQEWLQEVRGFGGLVKVAKPAMSVLFPLEKL
jgi:ribonuclease BN (tRNA processing enzyme)